MKRVVLGVAMAALAISSARLARAEAEAMNMDQAVAIALARNRDVIAARLEIRSAELDQVAASLYPNPVLSYSMNNLVVGAGNQFNVANGAPQSPSFFAQPVQSVGISGIIDVWAKRGAHMRAADRGLEFRRFQVADALRDIVHEVRSAFAEVEREQYERRLAHEMQDRYEQTIRLSRVRYAAGEISQSELRKIELEGLKYQTDAVAADAELDLARQKLAALLGLTSDAELPPSVAESPPRPLPLSVSDLIGRALESRPDVKAAERARALSEASLSAARRDALPDITLGLSYTHSGFTVSGDNPNTLGLGVSLPLPIFDRNQANIGRAELGIKQAENEAARLAIVVREEVANAARRAARAKTLLDVFTTGGMLDRADQSLRVAETSYRAGAISLLELLEAERTYLETRAQYLRTQYDYEQSRVDLEHAVGSNLQ